MSTEEFTPEQIAQSQLDTEIVDLADPNIQVVDLNDLGDDVGAEDIDDENLDEDELLRTEQYNGYKDDEDMEGVYGEDEEHAGMSDANIVDMAHYTITNHKDSVYSVAFNPLDSNLITTGGGDDASYYTCLDTQQTTLLGKYIDSVNIVAYNFDGSLVAVGVMDGLIKIYASVDGSEVCEFSCESDLETLVWHQQGNVLLAGTSDGLIWMWDVNTQMPMLTLQTLKTPIKRILYTTSGNGFLTCDEEGVTTLRSCKNGAEAMKWKEQTGHKAAILQMALLHTPQALMATADETGKIHIVSLKTSKVLSIIPAHQDSIEGLEFAPTTLTYLASASVDGTVKIIDYNRNNQIRNTLVHPDTVTKIQWHPTLPYIITACNDGIVRIFDVRTGTVTHELTGHKDAILDLTISKDAKYILTGSDDKTAKVFLMPELQ